MNEMQYVIYLFQNIIMKSNRHTQYHLKHITGIKYLLIIHSNTCYFQLSKNVYTVLYFMALVNNKNGNIIFVYWNHLITVKCGL